MKINTLLDLQGNEIKLASPEKVTTLPDSNLFIGRTCILISEKEADESTISVGSIYYYDGEQWCNIKGESLKIDETKINVIDDEITLYTFDTISDAVTYVKSNDKLKSVIIGENAGVTSIDSDKFKNSRSLKSITIPGSVTSIYDGAFYGCISLTSIDIANGVTYIGKRAFLGCKSLTSITIPGSVIEIAGSSTGFDDGAFSSCIALTTVIMCDGVTIIGRNTFSSCESLKSVTIPSSVTSIGDYAFEGCESLTYIAIPNSVTSIGAAAFENCKSLTSITIPSSVTSIGPTTFAMCTSLKDATIPNGVTSISDVMFSECTSLESVTIPSSVTSIGYNAFNGCTSLKSITIPNGVTSIDRFTFFRCTSLTSITIPSSVTSIDSTAFAGCDVLALDAYKSRTGYPWGATKILIHNEDVTTTIDENSVDRQIPTAKAVYDALSGSGSSSSIDDTKINVIDDEITVHTFSTLSDAKTYIKSNSKPKSVVIGENAGITSIGNSAFDGCTFLTSMYIPDSVTSIGAFAFENCKSLESINIPSSITSISDCLFRYCTSLTSIYIPDGVTSIGSGVFNDCKSLTSIDIPYTVTSIDTNAFNGCTSLTSIDMDYTSDVSIGNYAFANCTSLESIEIYEGSNTIGNYAFQNCTSLKTISIYGLSSVGEGAFENCTSFTGIVGTLTSIGANAFRNCTSLTSFDDISIELTSVASSAFENCTSLTSIEIDSEYSNMTSIDTYAFRGCTSLTSITIPNKVTSIANNAFENCTSLKSITIPDNDSIIINNNAFKNCTSLKSITIPDSVTRISSNAFAGCDILALENYKSRTGYPWGATDILIHNEDVTTTINAGSTDRQVPTAKAIYDFSIDNTKINVICEGDPKLYTFTTIADTKTFINSTGTPKNVIIGENAGITSIDDNAFNGCAFLESITIPDSVTSIGNSAFGNCKHLTFITIRNGGVTSIGDAAFVGCESLTYIAIPNSVTSIGTNVFAYCKSLISVSMSNSIESISKNAFGGCTSLESITIPSSVTSIGDGAFADCKSLKSITIPSGVTSIGTDTFNGGTFAGCTSLKSITMPDSVTSIGGSTFSNCTSLESITISKNLTSITYGAFWNCKSLTSITIPSSVTEIGARAFYNCKSLISITIPNSVTSIEGGTFENCTSLIYITIPDSVTSIGGSAFESCTSLKSITIPNSVTDIAASSGDNVFRNCTSLKSITMSNNAAISINAFYGCDILILDNYKSMRGYPWGATSILIHNEDVTTTIDSNNTDRQVPTAKAVYDALASSSGDSSIDETKINVMREGDPELHTFDTIANARTFINSTNTPKHVIIGSNTGITSIGDQAFANCAPLTSVTIPSGITSIGNQAFANCTSLTHITIPSSVTSIGNYAFAGCTFLELITIPSGVTSIGSYTFASCKSLASITIPSGVTSIGDNAFVNCAALAYISIPSSVTSIGDWAFSGCKSLTSISIPKNVTNINSSVFNGCTSLTRITISNGVTSIGDNAFSNCISLKSITIPSSVTSIGNGAFGSCTSLTSITIPSSVTSIGAVVFTNCISLTSITIPNDVTGIDSRAFSGCDILLLDNYKSRTGYPWGATDILIHNEDVTTTIDSNNTDRQVPTAKAVYDALASSTVDAYTKTETDTLLDAKANLVDGKIPASELPSYVDDVLEYTSTSEFPATGESGKIYVATDTNKSYRWSGTGYTEISQSLALGETSSTAYPGNKGKANADAIAAIKDGTNIDSFADVETALGNKADKSTTYTKTEVDTALATKLNTSAVTTTINDSSTDSQIPSAKAVYDVFSSVNIDDTKINVIDNEITLHTFDTLSDAVTFIDSTDTLKHVIIGSNAGITSIDDYTFDSCTSLVSINIPDGVTSIGDGAFQGCTSLTSINIPDSVTSIGNYAFAAYCTSLKSITIPSGVTSIGTNAFEDSSLTSITIPSGITSISDDTFSNCKSLRNVYMGSSSVTSIGDSAFNGCESLTSIIIPSGVTSIGYDAFAYCTSLTTITIPNDVTGIDSRAFSGCDILLLDSYKSRTGYPWGATEILIHNEDVTTTVDSNSTDRQVPTAKAVQAPLARLVDAGAKNLLDLQSPIDVRSVTATKIDNGGVMLSVTNATWTAYNCNCDTVAGTRYKLVVYVDSVTGSGTSAVYVRNDSGSGNNLLEIPSQAFVAVGINVYEFTATTNKTWLGIYPNNSSTAATKSIALRIMICTAEDYTISPEYEPHAMSNRELTENVETNKNNIVSLTANGGGKNKLKITATSSTEMTINDDGSVLITVNTSTQKQYTISGTGYMPNNYVGMRISGMTVNSNTSTGFFINVQYSNNGHSWANETNIATIGEEATILDYPYILVSIVVRGGNNLNGVLFKPMISVEGEPYQPYAKSNYELTQNVEAIVRPRYGFRIDKNNSDPDTRVEYLYDAVGMTPAKMTYDETTHKGTFNYGSWSNVWFVKNNRPVKLNFNGMVEAELNPNNYWETIDGQDSGLETATNCNFMSEIPIIYVKRWEDANYNYVVVCDKKYDEDYLAYANTDKDGNIKPLYAPIFKGYKDSNNILRSIAGVDPLNNTTTSNEVLYSNNINTAGSVTGWQIEDIAKHELISDLLTLISKSTDSQTIFGNGACNTSTRVFTGYNEVVTGTKTTKSDCGQFCGYNDNTHHVSVFHIQDFWGNRWDRCLGLITSDNKYYYKMTPENGGYTYTETISDYTNNKYTIAKDYSGNNITPPASGNIKNQSTGIFGNLPIDTTGASNSTYYCDYYWYNSSGVRLLLLGGLYGAGRSCGARCFNVNSAASDAAVGIGASPFYV